MSAAKNSSSKSRAKPPVSCAGLERLAADYPMLIENPRGLGLYQGFSLHSSTSKSAFLDLALAQESLLMLGAGTNSIRLRPSLSITNDEIDLLIDKLHRCAATLAAR